MSIKVANTSGSLVVVVVALFDVVNSHKRFKSQIGANKRDK